MPDPIVFVPSASMAATLLQVPAFPGELFAPRMPEAIGDVAQAEWGAVPLWSAPKPGVWVGVGEVQGELAYSLTVRARPDFVDFSVLMTNKSTRPWSRGIAFNCFRCDLSPSISDPECVRHWVRSNGTFRRLHELHRDVASRPTIQVYPVEGGPDIASLPFVNDMAATSAAVVEGWMAIQSRDGARLAAVVSKPALFVFQNMEYSCIHSALDLGSLQPGQSARGFTRVYLVESSLEQWYDRMRSELG
jgi:hypothetical protein